MRNFRQKQSVSIFNKLIKGMYVLLCVCMVLTAKSQTTYTSTVADVTLQCSGGTGNRTGVAYNPCFQVYYSVNAGNSSYPIETFASAGGNALNSTNQGADYRGYWWNSVNNRAEGNTYNGGGVYSNTLNASGYALNTASYISGATMPNAQSMGHADVVGGFIYYYDSGTLYKYGLSSNLLVSATAISGLPVGTGNLNSYGVVYTGYPGADIGVYDYVNKRIYFLNSSTAAYTSSCTLPNTAPAAASFQMGFANNRFFLYNTSLNQWYGYPVGNAPPPTVPTATIATSADTVCMGNPVTLTAGGANTYTWSNGSNNAITVVNPTANTIYTCVATNSLGCIGINTIQVSIIPGVYVIASAVSSVICIGNTASLSAGGGVLSYTWSPIGSFGGSNSANINDVPLTTTSYTVYGTNNIGCVSQDIVTVYVNDPHITNVSVSNPVICEGQSSTIVANGASTYSWSSQNGTFSNITSGTLVVNTNNMPSGLYNVTGIDSVGCLTPPQSALITMLAPHAIISGTNEVCKGKFITLTASGANSYTWSTGANSTTVSISPSFVGTHNYSVVGSQSQDNVTCYSSAQTTITMYNSPAVTALSNRNPACRLELITLTAVASGATSYTWTNGTTSTLSSVWKTAPQTTPAQIYTITVANQYGCSDSFTLEVKVNPCVGIAETDNYPSVQLSVYPNPNKGEFVISSEQAMDLQIINELGQVVKTLHINKNTTEVKLNDLSRGIYFIIGKTENGTVKEKIVIEK